MSGNPANALGHRDRPASAPPPLAAILVTGLTPTARHNAVLALIERKPAAQRWVVVRAGLVAHHTSGMAPAGVEFATLPSGCLCCAGLLPFRVGLTRLLRRLAIWAPTLLIIDAGTESHTAAVRAQLAKPDFTGLLRLATTVAAIDAHKIDSAPPALRQALGDLCAAADLVVCEAGAEMVSVGHYARFCAEFGVSAPLLAARDPACAAYLGLGVGVARA